MFLSVFTIAAAQIIKAILDIALFSWYAIHIHSLSNQNNEKISVNGAVEH